jgi:hypothetical protein
MAQNWKYRNSEILLMANMPNMAITPVAAAQLPFGLQASVE